ncbi:MAG: hypothetical protein K2N85_14675 [Lachnospiraceae bacterium]|nr:hypothetical protein [Lachnospiraceae bacterium]
MINGIIYGISVFVGIIAGIGVTIGVDFFKEKKQNGNDKKNLAFEINCNLSKIDKWIELINELRNYVNSDRVNQFSGYFNLSSAIFFTTNKLLLDGRIYTYLSHDSIEKLQENGTYLSLVGENMLNNQITQHKQAIWNGYINVKQLASNDIDFWDKALRKCKDNFIEILKELK